MATVELGSTVITNGWGYSASEPGSTINGGYFQRPLAEWDPELKPWSEWHRVNIAMTVRGPNIQVCGSRFDNVGDAVAVAAINQYRAGDNFCLGSLKATRVHDDFIENDGMRTGVVFNCLGDGVFNGFSCRPVSNPPSRTGVADSMYVEKCLIRLQSFYNSYNTPKYGFNRHGSFFKWSSYAPPIELKDNAFAAASLGLDSASLDPPSTLRRSTGTTLLWLGEGQWPEHSLARWRQVEPAVKYLSGAAASALWQEKVSGWKR